MSSLIQLKECIVLPALIFQEPEPNWQLLAPWKAVVALEQCKKALDQM